MKQIKQIQYDTILTLYQKLRSALGEKATLSDIKALEYEIFSSSYRGPMSGAYRLDAYKEVDPASLSTELGTCASDATTLFEFLNEAGKQVGIYRFALNVWNHYIHNMITSPLMTLTSLISSSFIEGSTDEISIATSANTDETTATITEEGYITLHTLSNVNSSYELQPQDVVVSRLGDGEVSIRGDVYKVFHPSNTTSSVIELIGSKDPRIRIEAKVNATSANTIIIRAKYAGAVHLTVEGTSDRTFSQYYSSVTSSNLIEIPLSEQTDIRVLRLTMRFATPARYEQGIPVYSITIRSMRVAQTTKETDAVYVSKPLPVPGDDTKRVALVVEDSVKGSATIRYFIGLVSQGGTSLVEVKPGTIVDLGRRHFRLPSLGPGELWSLQFDPSTGSRFYNILEVAGTVNHIGTTVISNGAFNVSGNPPALMLIPKSLRLYRGVDNYVRSSGNEQERALTRPITHKTELASDSKSVETVPILTMVTETVTSASMVGNRIRLMCTPVTPQFVFKENNESAITVTVNNYGFDTYPYVEISGDDIAAIQNSKSAFTVTYTATLRDYATKKGNLVKIIPGSVTIKCKGTVFSYEKDYLIDYAQFVIHLIEHGSYYKLCDRDTDGTLVEIPTIDITYTLKEAVGSQSDYIWTTWIYTANITTVTIRPFTTVEVSAGNFHKIDGFDVSTQTSVTLQPGWHYVETTQPYPTVYSNSADVNVLTKQPSQAGIIFPDSVEMRAYRDSMRLVSEFTLSSLPAQEAKKCFTYKDGKILLAYRPECVSYDMINSPGLVPVTGQSLLCRKVVYDSSLVPLYYEPVPERFIVECDYLPTSGDNVTHIIVRAELSAPQFGDAALITRLGINRISGGNSA